MKKRLFCLIMLLVLALLQTAFSEGDGEQGAPAAGTWICPNCGESNTGTFCEECGTAKPGWVCICGSHNEKKFCPVCGTSYEALSQTYEQALQAYGNGDYQTAAAMFEYLKGFNDSAAYLEECRAALPTPEPLQGNGINYDDSGYDPSTEEGGQDEEISAPAPLTPAPTTAAVYAGTTPVPIFPVDMSTTTPVPSIEFKKDDFTTYEASELHLSFQGPAGWILEGPTGWSPDSNEQDTYILTNPDLSMDYAATIRIRVVPVNRQYSQNDLIKEVKAIVDTLRRDRRFAKFDPSKTAGREFIDGKGVYMAYTGTLAESNVRVAGRVMVNCVKKTLYILECSYPGALADSYADVYNKARSTMKLIK